MSQMGETSSSSSSSTVAERARVAWRMRLSSALRTAVACAVLGGVNLYGPRFPYGHLKFAAFSYLTAVVIVSDATLGDTVRGCWHALLATVQVEPLAMLWRWGIQRETGLPVPAAAVVVAAAAFLVAVPERTHLTVKKIAFGQIVLVCSEAVLSDGASDGFMHPLYLAVSTALGALASVIALLVPFPGFASHKVQELCKIYADNASQRMKVYIRALSATDPDTKIELMSRANALSEAGAKLLQSIRILEDGLWWERPWSRAMRPGERLQSMELEMRGIEYSLLSSSSTTRPLQATQHEQLPELLQTLSTRVEEKIEQVRCYSPFNLKVKSEATESVEKLPSIRQGWLFLYFSCMDMFLNDTICAFPASIKQDPPAGMKPDSLTRFKKWAHKLTSYDRLQFATKCSLCLGLAMLLGLTFDKENGCWAGLTIAISFVRGRQAIFTIANSRVQGTALGSVYGIICCFIFHHREMKLAALLPWIVFTGLLKHSRMYGQTGGVSAAIAGLVILGRKNYGPPTEFAIARLTEVFIGLSAFVLVELCLQPARAATLAKRHTYQTLSALQDSMKVTNQTPLELREKHMKLNSLVSQLKDYVSDAEVEPSFWYLPFRASAYRKLIRSLSDIVDMLSFITHNLDHLSKLAETSTRVGTRFQEQIHNEVRLFQETLTSLHIYQQQASATDPEPAIDQRSRGKESVVMKEHAEVEWDACEEEDEEQQSMRERMIQCLSATRFCINSVVRELENVKVCMRGLKSLED